MKIEYTGAQRHVYIWAYTDEGEVICTHRFDVPLEVVEAARFGSPEEAAGAGAIIARMSRKETPLAEEAARSVLLKGRLDGLFDERIRPTLRRHAERWLRSAQAEIPASIPANVRVCVEVDILDGDGGVLAYYVVSSEDEL